MVECEFCEGYVMEEDHITGEYCCKKQSKKQLEKSNDRAFSTGWSVVKAKKCPSCGGKMGHQWDRDGVCYSCADMEVQNEGGSDV